MRPACHQQVAQQHQSGSANSIQRSWGRCHTTPQPLFDSRAAAAAAASCCIHAATADVASPSRWIRKLVSRTRCNGASGVRTMHTSSELPQPEAAEALYSPSIPNQTPDLQRALDSSCPDWAPATTGHEAEQVRETKAVGCSASPSLIESCRSRSTPRNFLDNRTDHPACPNASFTSVDFKSEGSISVDPKTSCSLWQKRSCKIPVRPPVGCKPAVNTESIVRTQAPSFHVIPEDQAYPIGCFIV